MTKRTPSPQQQALIDFPITGRGSVFGEATAGSGKTTTALWAVNNMRGSVAVMAFNKAAANEFAHKAQELGLNFDNRVRFGTCHSFGLSGWRYVHKNVKCGPEAARAKADMTAVHLGLNDQRSADFALRTFVPRLISFAKQGALGLFGSLDDISQWYDIVEHYDMAYELEDEALVPRGIELAIKGIKYHREIACDIIDFDDMIYMPVVTGIRMWQNDWVVGDEWQDANAARRALARKMLKSNGRAMFIGDRHQAIYGFAGADNDSIATTIREFKCSELPLTVSYRCPKAVIAKAQEVVSHIQAHDAAPEGKVATIPLEALMRNPDDVEPGVPASEYCYTDLTAADAILCRKTKPLVEMAFTLIRNGVACHVEGKDIGASLITLVKKFENARTLTAMLERLDAYVERRCEKLKAKGKEGQAESLSDRAATIHVIAAQCTTMDDLKTRITSMFEDGDSQRRPTLTLSTIHKAKGREWPRVFILGRNAWMPGPWARQAWEQQQEQNLIYVAYTRAKSELVMIDVTAEKQ
jgi:superfamily I DNA/RNA helicase